LLAGTTIGAFHHVSEAAERMSMHTVAPSFRFDFSSFLRHFFLRRLAARS